MSALITWKPNEDSDNITSYHIERSIVGVETSNVSPYAITAGQTIQIRIDGGNLLTIALNAITSGAATAAQIATLLDAALNAHGGSAKVSSNGTKVIIYSNRQTDRGGVNIKGGTALAGLGILAGIRKFQSEVVDIAQVSHPTATYTDEDGDAGYQYRLRAENSSSALSGPTAWFSPFKEVIPTSVIYGYLIDPEGKALEDTRVQFGPPINKRPSDDALSGFQPNSSAQVGISLDHKEVYSDANGYFQFVVPANTPIRIKIDSVGHDFVYKTPTAGSQKDFTDLTEATSYASFALEGGWGI